MIGYRVGGSFFEFDILTALGGERFVKIELTYSDLQKISGLHTNEYEDFVDWLKNVYSRVLPENNEHLIKSPINKKQPLGKGDALRIIKLFSAIEGWSFGVKESMPSYFFDEINEITDELVKIALGIGGDL